MYTETKINPLVAFALTILLVAAVLIGSAATTRGTGGGLAADASPNISVPG